MSKIQRTFTREFKVEAVKLAQSSQKPLAQIARDRGIADTTLQRWHHQFSGHGEQAFPGSGHQLPHEEEIGRLQRENELLRQERDILKKALGVFSRSQRMPLPVHCRALPGGPDHRALPSARGFREWL